MAPIAVSDRPECVVSDIESPFGMVGGYSAAFLENAISSQLHIQRQDGLRQTGERLRRILSLENAGFHLLYGHAESPGQANSGRTRKKTLSWVNSRKPFIFALVKGNLPRKWERLPHK